MLDSADELLRKIQLGEDSVLELKSVRFRGVKVDGPARNDFADELAAMANTADGVCVLGVDDKTREIEGIPIERLDSVEDFVREVCNDTVKPPLTVKIIRMELPDYLGTMRAVIKIDVPRSLFVHKSPAGYFRRQGSSKRELPPDLLARLFQQRSQARIISFDEQPVPETTLDDLDEARLTRFIPPGSSDAVSTVRKLRLLTNDDAGVERATVAGVLMCSAHPETWLPGAYVEAVRYQGSRQDSNYQVDASSITGSLDEQVAGALAFVRRNMRIAALKAPARVEVPQFSERAVFEAIVNAVAHRDYSVHGSKIRLFVFDDRLELYSPGPLPNTVTVESIGLRQATRNELITSLLARCPVAPESQGVARHYLMEKRGDGVPIIMNESYRLSAKYPEYRLIDDAELLLTIYSAELSHEDEGAWFLNFRQQRDQEDPPGACGPSTRSKKENKTVVQVIVDEALLQEMVRRLVEAIDPDRIILFGSRARGDERPDSDVDLLVIKDSDEPPHKRSIPAYRALGRIPAPTDILWRTPDEVRDWSEVQNYVTTRALREGRVLYEKRA